MSDKTLKQKQQRQDKEKQAYTFYISKGWTPEQAIGIVGNLIRESNLNTTVVGTADDKGSQGIAQWHSGRLRTLKDRYGDKWTDFRNQLEFVDWELKNTEKAAGNKLKDSKGIWEAGRVVSDSYERPKIKFSGDVKRQRHVSDLAMKFKGVKLTPEDMPYYEASYTKSVAPYINQQKKTVTPTLNYFDIPKETTTFASVPDSAEKEEITEKIDKDIVEVEQKTKEYNFLEELQKEDYSHLQPQQVAQQQTVPQVDFMQQYEQVSQFIDEPLVAQQGLTWQEKLANRPRKPTVAEIIAEGDARKTQQRVQTDNIPNTKRDLSLMLAEHNNIKKDEQELRTTGQIKNPNSIQYRRNIKTQPDIKQDNISTEQRNAPLNPLQRPLIYLATQGQEEPKKFQSGGSVKEDKEWLQNWYQNRVIPDEVIQNEYFLPQQKDYINRAKNLKDPKVVDQVTSPDGMPVEGVTRANGDMELSKNAAPHVQLHEMTHSINKYPFLMQDIHESVVKQNIAPIEGIENEDVKKYYDYFSNPEEVHARIQVLRKEAKIKPDQKVTSEFLQNYLKTYKGENSNINDLLNVADEPHLLEMLNYMAETPKNKEKQYIAQQGGEFSENELAFLSEIAIKDNNGYWDKSNQGKVVEIEGNKITMNGVKEDLIGISKQTGEKKIMKPNKNYTFSNTKSVIEIPLFKNK